MQRPASWLVVLLAAAFVALHANKVYVGINSDDDEFAAAMVERYGADRVRVENVQVHTLAAGP